MRQFGAVLACLYDVHGNVPALDAAPARALGALPESAEIADWMVVHGSLLADVDGFAAERSDDDERLRADSRRAAP